MQANIWALTEFKDMVKIEKMPTVLGIKVPI